MTTKSNTYRPNKDKSGSPPIYQEFRKIPPQCIDVEEVVLGGIIIESKAFYLVSPILTPESFYKEEHQKIYSTIEDLSNQRIKIDLITITNELKKKDYLEEVGGAAYVARLTSLVSINYHIEDHARIIQQKFIARKLIEISSETTNRSFDDSIDVADVIDYLQVELNKIVKKSISRPGVRFDKIAAERIKELETIGKNKVEYSGIPCGYGKIDRHTGGWQNSDFIIIAARPSMGKSYLAIRFAVNACKLKYRVLVFSLEMSSKQLFDRELSNETGIENSRIRKADFTPFEWEQIETALARFEKYDLIIDDTPALTIMEFKAKALMYKIETGIDLIVIDYIQRMRSPAYSLNKNLEIGDISGNLKSMAKELNIPIIAVSQLSRKVDDRTTRRPVLSDLRDSGDLEQDADLVAFIHRPEYYGIKKLEDESDTKNLIEFIIAKHRNGAVGTMKLWKNSNWTEINESLPGENYTSTDKEEPASDDLPF